MLDEIIRDYNTSDYWDPHQCINSCQDPEYDCLACTNPDYFQCTKNNISVCIHPDLKCNQHPDCDEAEDEKFEDCIDTYEEKVLVKEYATLRCASKIYPNMETVATVCDDIIECHNMEDEPETCRKNDANLYLAISVGSILTIYLGLKSYFSLMKRRRRNGKLNIYELMPTIEENNVTDVTVLRKKLNFLCLHIKNYYDTKAKTRIGLKIYHLEESLETN